MINLKNHFLLFTLFFSGFIFCGSLVAENKPADIFSTGNGDEAVVFITGMRKYNPEDIGNVIKQKIISGKISIPDNRKVFVLTGALPYTTSARYPITASGVNTLFNFPTKNWNENVLLYSKTYNCGTTPLDTPETEEIASFFKQLHIKKVIAVIIDYDLENSIKLQTFTPPDISLSECIQENTGFKRTATIGVSGNFGTWLSEQYSIPSVFIGVKKNTETSDTAIEKIIKSAVSFNFKNLSDSSSPDAAQNKNLEKYIFSSLPAEIKMTEEVFNNFYELFMTLNHQDKLLILVNKEHYLNAAYEPEDIIKLDKTFTSTKSEMYLSNSVTKELKNMLDSASHDGIKLILVSGYRSYNTQKTVFQKWVTTLGQEEALRVSAKPGSSQHQLGTAIDFNMLDERFENTAEGKWLKNNAYRYGFILSFPKNMESFTGYRYEPWHYRYLGKNTAYIICHYFNNNLELFLRWYWSLTEY